MHEPPATPRTLPESMQLPALDSDEWVEFLGTFRKGFPDLHLEVQDAVAARG